MPLAPLEHHRLDVETLPSAVRAHVDAVYEIVYPVDAGAEVTFPVSAHLTPILNLTLGRVTAAFGAGLPVLVPPLVLSGPQPQAYCATASGPLRGFYAIFRPSGPLALLGVRRYGTHPGAVSMPDLVRPSLADAARTFETALVAAPDFEARTAALVAFFDAAAAGIVPTDLDDARRLDALVAAVEAAEGCLRVEALADELGVSASTLRRRTAVLGLPLKRLIDIVRLRAAVAFLHTTAGATWGDVVGRYGYADQAHFIRTHHRLTGVPPTRWDDRLRGIDHQLGMKPAV